MTRDVRAVEHLSRMDAENDYVVPDYSVPLESLRDLDSLRSIDILRALGPICNLFAY